jgi:hypothetical protein
MVNHPNRKRKSGRGKRQPAAAKGNAAAFQAMLADNEKSMGEHAAFAVTCEMMGISEDEGYDLLICEGEGEGA